VADRLRSKAQETWVHREVLTARLADITTYRDIYV
jgi:hypothetical protein